VVFPKYTYDQFDKIKDPMNIIFKNATLDEIKLRFDQFNWRFRGKYAELTWDQFTPDLSPRSKQDAQRVKGSFWKRYHVRIWKLPDTSYHVASAHNERFTLAFGHKPYNFESAKDRIEETFDGSDNWEIKPGEHDLENRDDETYHNGLATEIEHS